jgi:hypothetical protein
MEQSPFDPGDEDDAGQPATEPRGALVPPPTHPPTAVAAASDPPPRLPRVRSSRRLRAPAGLFAVVERVLDLVDSVADRVADAAGLRARVPRDPSSAYDGPVAGPPPPG